MLKMTTNLTHAKSLLRTLCLSVKLFAAAHLFLQYGYEVHGTFGPSMLPTLNIAGDWCLVDKYHHAYGKDLSIGDLVVASRPGHPEMYILKRLIGKVSKAILQLKPEFLPLAMSTIDVL